MLFSSRLGFCGRRKPHPEAVLVLDFVKGYYRRDGIVAAAFTDAVIGGTLSGGAYIDANGLTAPADGQASYGQVGYTIGNDWTFLVDVVPLEYAGGGASYLFGADAATLAGYSGPGASGTAYAFANVNTQRRDYTPAGSRRCFALNQAGAPFRQTSTGHSVTTHGSSASGGGAKTIRLGAHANGTAQNGGKVRSLVLYLNKSFTDAQLQALTV